MALAELPNLSQSQGQGGAGSQNFLDQLTMMEQNEILTWCEEQYTQCRKARLQFEQTWYTNLAFFFGKQYVQWAPNYATPGGTYQRLYEPKAPSWRVRMIVNKIRAIIRSEHAKLCKENPQPYVIPASTDDTDIAAARAAENVYDFLWRDLKMRRVIRRMAWWLCLTGNGFIKDWYDPTTPDSSGIPGAIRAQPVSPFHIYVPEVDTEEIEEQPCIIHALTKTTDYVMANFGKVVTPDSGSDGLFEQKFLQALGVQQAGRAGYDRVTLREITVKPCGMWPLGATITWASGVLLALAPTMPFGHGEYTLTKFDHIPTGRFYAESVITDLIPMQKEYNRTRSQIVEAKNRMAKPQLVAVEGSVDHRKITSEPGLVIYYKPGYPKPEQVDLKPIPNYVIEELDRCQNDMNDISSQHEISKGQAPPGVTAATAISYLQEEDDSKLSNTISSIEEGVEKVGKHLLMHVQEYWDLPRTVRVVGGDGMYESYVLSSSDIAGNTDLNIQSGSAMPRSRAAKQALIMELSDKGLIPPNRVFRYLNMAETNTLYEEMQRNVRQAQRENLKMMQGDQSVTVNSWDEHQAHVEEHNNYRKGQSFEQAPDQIKMIFEQHVQLHQMQMQTMMIQAAQQQAIGGGMGGQPQGGPPPQSQAQPMPGGSIA
jgi:hypothetical protein